MAGSVQAASSPACSSTKEKVPLQNRQAIITQRLDGAVMRRTEHSSPRLRKNRNVKLPGHTEAEVVWAASRRASCTRGFAETGHHASATSTFRVTSTLQHTVGQLEFG